MAKIPDEEKELIKNRVRYYIVVQGGRWVSDAEIGKALGHDREFIGQLRKEIRKEDLEAMNKWKVADALIKLKNTYMVASQELWTIAFSPKDPEGRPIPIKSKIYALVKAAEMDKELVELFQSVGVWPRIINEDLLKDREDITVNILELLEQILGALPDEDVKQKVIEIIANYAKNLDKPKPEQEEPEQQPAPEQNKPEQETTPPVESKIYEI